MRTRHRWVSVGRDPLQRAEHQAEQAWTTRRKQKCWDHSPNGALQSQWWRPGRSLRQRVMRQTRRQGKWTTQMEGEVSQRDTDDVESISDGEARHRSSPSDPTPREIQDHVLTGHACFRSWCAACVTGRGRAERDIVVMATKKMRTVPKFQYCQGINFFCRKRPKRRCRHRAARRQSRPGDSSKRSGFPGLREGCENDYQRFGQFGVPQSRVSV